MSEQTAIYAALHPQVGVVSGIWKFADHVLPETLVMVAREFLATDGERYTSIHVRKCSKNQYGISFMYNLGDEATQSAGENYSQFFNRMTDQLKRLFGNGLVGWDVADQVWIVK